MSRSASRHSRDVERCLPAGSKARFYLTVRNNVRNPAAKVEEAPMFMSAADYRESLRRYSPRVFIDGHAVESVADDPRLAPGIAMTDAKGDRSKRPSEQANPDVYVHIAERRNDGIVIRGAKAIVTAAPYVHEFLVMPCRRMRAEDAAFAVCCAVPVDAPGVTIAARPAGRPGEAAAKFSARYGQSTGIVLFENVFVPWERVVLAGECEEAGLLTT